VRSSGYIPPVSIHQPFFPVSRKNDLPSKRALLSNSSDTSNLLANPGKCHTGSMAALYVFTSIPGSFSGKAGKICDFVTILPSTLIDPVELARSSSVILIWALVHEIVGFTSRPESICCMLVR
jgi:hypothetical protein